MARDQFLCGAATWLVVFRVNESKGDAGHAAAARVDTLGPPVGPS
jgi:hypothetical protein